MNKILWPSIAVTCLALYFFTRKRKVDLELEIEPVESPAPAAGNEPVPSELPAE